MRRHRNNLITAIAALTVGVAVLVAAPAGQALAAPVASATDAKTAPGMPKFGESGPKVAALQAAIIKNGFTLKGGASGVFDKRTLSVLRTFQKVVGLKVTGVVDAQTAKVLNLNDASTTTTVAPTTIVAPTTTTVAPAQFPLTEATLPVRGNKSDAVVTVQKALVAAGIVVKGGVDGVFGVATTVALQKYQAANGLAVTGTADVATAIKLGLVKAPATQISVFPVQGKCSFVDTWHAPRGNGRLHLGVDIIAPEGNLIYAAVDGTITKLYTAGTDKLAGNGFRLTMADGTYFFYGHLRNLADGIGVGSVVKAGQVLGYNGHTGDTNTPHLHFEMHPRGGDAENAFPVVKAVDACSVTAPRG